MKSNMTKVMSKIPLMCLILFSIVWWYFFNHDLWLNDYGAAKSDWLLLIDIAITLPIICFLCIKPRKLALLKSLSYFALFVFIGSLIIPKQYQVLWPYLTELRFILLVGFVFIELSVIGCVIFAIKQAIIEKDDPDMAIEKPIKKIVGDGVLASLLKFETRVWSFVFCSRFIKPSAYRGEQHFSYHLKDANQSNALGFILMICFEIPLMHLVIHFVCSAFAANVITVVTCLSLVFFVAEYLAMSRRPMSIDSKFLYIRYGVFNCLSIPISDITMVKLSSGYIRRGQNIKRYNFSGNPNICISYQLSNCDIKTVYLGIDNPNSLVNALAINHKLQS
ncbi:hypothetical protein [uncultured Shewanella sp.]|uniref:hypothetical protein n=1 Tax=uncultured Shewanella sp. TaxID=173975 RepID=UPI00261B486E|nr:hypothetical protein [uncultured Shewanella sp.]